MNSVSYRKRSGENSIADMNSMIVISFANERKQLGISVLEEKAITTMQPQDPMNCHLVYHHQYEIL